MNATKYNAIRKTSWDSLWHALYTVDGCETWDRIPENEALAIARALPPHLPHKSLLNRPPACIQRDGEPARGMSWPLVENPT